MKKNENDENKDDENEEEEEEEEEEKKEKATKMMMKRLFLFLLFLELLESTQFLPVAPYLRPMFLFLTRGDHEGAVEVEAEEEKEKDAEMEGVGLSVVPAGYGLRSIKKAAPLPSPHSLALHLGDVPPSS
jgi:hypothetical protein